MCRACPAFGVCTKDKRHGRALEIGPHDAALRRHRAWMSTEEAKGAYRWRMQLVEPVFGIIKEQQQAHRFLLRGLTNVSAEWSLLATAFNLRALWRIRRAAATWTKHWVAEGAYSAYRALQTEIVGTVSPLLRLMRAPPSASPTKPTPHVKHNLHLKQTPRACPPAYEQTLYSPSPHLTIPILLHIIQYQN